MLKHKKIKVGTKHIDAYAVKLASKNLIILIGSRGYLMCGYLNLKVAEKFKDTAAKIVGVASIEDALSSSVHSCTSCAKRLGIFKGQPVKEILKLIA